MPLTDEYLVSEQPHFGGVQRLYQFPSGWGLSLVNSPKLHAYAFAWEAAVIGPDGALDYTTELTSDVIVFSTEQETNQFIERAIEVLCDDSRLPER